MNEIVRFVRTAVEEDGRRFTTIHKTRHELAGFVKNTSVFLREKKAGESADLPR
jgi:hypothetical protein